MRVVAPRDAVEFQLCDIWAAVLGVPSVDIDDDFFDLGGDSLHGTRILMRIERLFGVTLALNDFVTTPTVTGVAATIRSGRDESTVSPLVRLKDGDGAPVYALHPMPGTVLGYTAFARALGSSHAVWGLQSAGLDPGVEPHDRIEPMAEHYLRCMRDVHDGGPWHLVGHSMGGLLAFEMARQLRRDGENVGLIGLFDTLPPGRAPIKSLDDARVLAVSNVVRNVLRLDIDVDWLASLPMDHRIDVVLETAVTGGQLPADYDADRVRRLFEIRVHNTLAMAEYLPGRYEGELTFFEASEPSSVTPLAGPFGFGHDWRPFAGSVTVHRVPGTHSNVLERENIGVAAGLLRDRLSRR